MKQRVYEIWDWGIFDPDKVKGLVGDISRLKRHF